MGIFKEYRTMNALIFLLATMIFIIFSWIYVAYCYLKKRKLSNAYGLLAISYITHAVSLQIVGIPSLFYVIFSVIWIVFHSIYRKAEKNQINKNE